MSSLLAPMIRGSLIRYVPIVCLLAGSVNSHADDTLKEVRPSHLLNIETADTQAARNLVLSEFGASGGRVAYGVTDGFETRADAQWRTTANKPNPGTSYNGALTEKFHLYATDWFGVAIQGSVANLQNMGIAPTTTTLQARLPVTLKFSRLLFTAVGYFSETTVKNDVGTVGGEFGAATPLGKWVDLIGEFTLYTKRSATVTGFTGGIAMKPAKRITIPLVLASNSGGTTNVGIINFIAHIGFEL